MTHTDGFLLMSANAARDLTWEPDKEVPEFSPQDWARSYAMFATREEADTNARETAEMTERDEGEAAPRDTPLRVRVFGNGAVAFYGCPAGHQGMARIGEEETPLFRLSRTEIFRQFGIEPPVPEDAIAPGEHRCSVIVGHFDRDGFLDYFETSPEDVLPEQLEIYVFPPCAGEEELGAVLIGIETFPHPRGAEWRLTVRIDDPDTFLLKICEAGRDSGRGRDWVPENVAEAIFEGWCGANETPSPVDIGFSILESRAPEEDAPSPGM